MTSVLQQQIKLRAEAATTLHNYGDGRLVLSPSTEPVPFTATIETEGSPEGLQVRAGIITPNLGLVEAHFYEQIAGSIDEAECRGNWDKIDPQFRMFCVAWTIHAQGAILGEMVDHDGTITFNPLEGLEQLEVLKNQSPMIYGQHMRCDGATWEACMKFLREQHNFEVVEFDRAGPQAAPSPRRRTVSRLGAPTKGHGNYAARLPQRIKHSVVVDRVTLLGTSPDRVGFRDPLTALMGNLELVAMDAESPDEDVRRRANSLASSLTGITRFAGSGGQGQVRAPQQAGIGELTLAGEPFNFFTMAPVPASAVVGNASPFTQTIEAGDLAKLGDALKGEQPKAE